MGPVLIGPDFVVCLRSRGITYARRIGEADL